MASESEDGQISDSRQGIQSVELSMLVLRAIELNRSPMSLTAIAAACEMGASKVHRYLVSLTRIGFVSQSRNSGLYDLGPTLRRLGIEAMRRMDEVGVASEHVSELRDRIGHAVNLSVWSDRGPVIVRWEYGASTIPITVRVGATMPLISSSIGRTFLAYLPEQLTAPIVESELQQGGRGALSRKEIADIIAEVKRKGVAETSGAVIPGLASISAPVFSSGESLPMVIALAIPAGEANRKTMDSLREELLRTTHAISEELGFQSDG